MTKVTPVILSGGSGTRLWPVSRSLSPKQFSSFFGEKSLFQGTINRTKNKNSFFAPIIICNNEHRFIAAEQLQKIDVEASSIILEPFGKNTAPAIAIAALDVLSQHGLKDDLMLVMPSDHKIEDEKGFVEHVVNAKKAALEEYLVTFGIVPKKAETGYGYIKKARKIQNIDNCYLVEKFTEKPNKTLATKLVKDKNYFWNSGIFMFRASVYLQALQKHCNEIFLSTCNSYNKSVKDLDFIRLHEEDFSNCPDISIDYAVMEKTQKAAISPMDVGWCDVGSWDTISEISAKDKDDNSLIGDVVAYNTKNCYINSEQKLVTTIGVKNLIIVAIKDAVLIANKNDSQDVKKLFNILKEQKREECTYHKIIHRPWGSFETIYSSKGMKVKKIIVKPKSSLSLQMHNHRAEHWIMVHGTAHVTCGSEEFVLTEDESTYIPIGKKHRLENKGLLPLELIEVQTGSYLGEDDIIRFSDIYGR